MNKPREPWEVLNDTMQQIGGYFSAKRDEGVKLCLSCDPKSPDAVNGPEGTCHFCGEQLEAK